MGRWAETCGRSVAEVGEKSTTEMHRRRSHEAQLVDKGPPMLERSDGDGSMAA